MSCLTAILWCSIFVPKAVMQESEIKMESMPPVKSDTDKKPSDDFAAQQASQLDITGPAGSGAFGTYVAALPNGNIVVTDPLYDAPGPIADVGAAYLYDGATGNLISTLTGSTASNKVGGGGITVLTNGHYVIRSPEWDSPVLNVGAATWCHGSTGCSGVVSSGNSLVGEASGDLVSNQGVVALPNGNYLVRSVQWRNGGASAAGAVTWGNGTMGISGTVSAANSLVGSTANDSVGNNHVVVLQNGNYLVQSSNWDNGGASDAGAVTWGSGATGVSGIVTSANSLVSSFPDNRVGQMRITELTNGNYLVRSPSWGSPINIGAATWGSGTSGVSGTISAANSLVGSVAGNVVGAEVSALSNGNYVVTSPQWDNGAIADVGAVTWGNGVTGTVGQVSAANSLVGSVTSDFVGIEPAFALANGNYVVRSYRWDNGGAADAGAVTWCSGTTGRTGAISPANSLVGTVANSFVGRDPITELANGHYIVRNSSWRVGALFDVGSVTWCNGTTGRTGAISSSNSLVGTNESDLVGNAGVKALTNGNYVVSSSNWRSGATFAVGAVTWANGATGLTGAVSAANSLTGSTSGDSIGNEITPLPNGNYLVSSPFWDNGTVDRAGAVTFCNGMTGRTGTVSATNSLVGSSANDQVSGLKVLVNGNYVVYSSVWDNGAVPEVGAVTWGSGTTGVAGTISAANSLIGSANSDRVGTYVSPLANGNYIVRSQNWKNGAVTNAGAITWGNGLTGTTGVVSAVNSLVGSSPNDMIGDGFDGTFFALSNGNYYIFNETWDNGATANATAITYGAGNGGTVGTISTDNSVLGLIAPGPVRFETVYDPSTERLIVGKRTSNTVTIFNPTYNAIANGNWSSAATWDYGAFTRKHDVVISSGRNVTLDTNIVANSVTVNPGGTLALNADRSSASPIANEGIIDISLGKLDMGVNLLTVGCSGLVNGAGASKYVLGSTRKDFCTTGSFTYPSGTANGYSPVTANVTALGTNPSGLTVSATQTPHPLVNQTNSLKRFWTLTESGDLTANLTFNYLDPTDILGTESSYRLFRVESGNLTAVTPFTLTTGANTIATNGVTNFSDWAVGNLMPLATISGRILTSGGRGVRNATVTMTDPQNVTRQAITGPFGAYQFTNVPTDVQYTFGVTSRRFTFTPQGFRAMNNFAGLNFVASP